MPSRINKYYRYTDKTKTRANKNSELYKTIYEEGYYTNVEGISIIEKNEKIDIEKIKELIGDKKTSRETAKEQIKEKDLVIEDIEEKSYDIQDVLKKARSERLENVNESTQYDILKSINLNKNCNVPTSLSDEDLKEMIEEITKNSRNSNDDLLDDLKTSQGLSKTNITEKEIEKQEEREIDKSFFTSSLEINKNDFEDLNKIKKDIKRNHLLTKILLIILLIIIIVGVIIFL